MWLWKLFSHVQLLWPHGLYTPWNSPGQNTSPGDLPNLEIELRSPALQVDSLLSESPGKPKNTGMGSLSILQGIFPMQESNRGVSNEKACTSSGRKYEQESKPTRFSQVSGSATNEYWQGKKEKSHVSLILRHTIHLIESRERKGFPGGSAVKNPPANTRESSSIPGPGRSPGEGNGNPLQYSCLENLIDRGAWLATVHRVTKESDRT